jgi:hypothetical protein
VSINSDGALPGDEEAGAITEREEIVLNLGDVAQAAITFDWAASWLAAMLSCRENDDDVEVAAKLAVEIARIGEAPGAAALGDPDAVVRLRNRTGHGIERILAHAKLSAWCSLAPDRSIDDWPIGGVS